MAERDGDLASENTPTVTKVFVVVVVRIFNATRHLRHIEEAAIVMYMYLHSLAFMDHPCTLGTAVCQQLPPCPLYTQPRARWVWARHTNGLKIISTRAGFEPTISYFQWLFSYITYMYVLSSLMANMTLLMSYDLQLLYKSGPSCSKRR